MSNHQQVASMQTEVEDKKSNTNGLFGRPNAPKLGENFDAELNEKEHNKYLMEIGDFFKMSSSPLFAEDGPLNNLNIDQWPKNGWTLNDFGTPVDENGKITNK